jgi:hypothetical protein
MTTTNKGSRAVAVRVRSVFGSAVGAYGVVPFRRRAGVEGSNPDTLIDSNPGRRLIASGVQACLDNDRGRDAGLPVGWDEPAHQLEQFVGEERVERGVIDVELLAIEDLDGAEAGLLEAWEATGLPTAPVPPRRLSSPAA